MKLTTYLPVELQMMLTFYELSPRNVQASQLCADIRVEIERRKANDNFKAN